MKTKIKRGHGKFRVVNYRRVGTVEQASVLLKEQADAYEQDRKRYGWTTVASIEDIGSGSSMNREGFKEVLRLIRAGEVDGVYVTDSDRLCRPEHLRDLVEFYEAFSSNDVRLVMPGGIYNLKGDVNTLSFDIKGVLAKHYRRRFIQSITEGKKKKANDRTKDLLPSGCQS